MCSIDKCFLKEYLQWAIPNDDTLRYESLDVGEVRDKHLRNKNYKLIFIWKLDYTYGELEDIISYYIDNSYLATLTIFLSKTGVKECEFIKEFISKNHGNKKYMRRIFEVIGKCYSLEEHISFLKLLLELNNDVDVFRNVLNPEMYVGLMGDESVFIENKLEFYNAVKKEMLDKDDYMSHIILLQDLINEYEMKLRV